MLTVLHCKDTLNSMKMPGCRNCHKMNILSLTNFFPLFLPSRIAVRAMMRCADRLFCSFYTIGFQVTKCPNLHTFDTCQSSRGTCSPVSEADHRYSYSFKCRGGIPMHIKTITVVEFCKRLILPFCS